MSNELRLVAPQDGAHLARDFTLELDQQVQGSPPGNAYVQMSDGGEQWVDTQETGGAITRENPVQWSGQDAGWSIPGCQLHATAHCRVQVRDFQGGELMTSNDVRLVKINVSSAPAPEPRSRGGKAEGLT